jgi:hypothetical protein
MSRSKKRSKNLKIKTRSRYYYEGTEPRFRAVKTYHPRLETLSMLEECYFDEDGNISSREISGSLHDDGDGIQIITPKLDVYLDYSSYVALKVLLDLVEVGPQLTVRKKLPKPYRRMKP